MHFRLRFERVFILAASSGSSHCIEDWIDVEIVMLLKAGGIKTSVMYDFESGGILERLAKARGQNLLVNR